MFAAEELPSGEWGPGGSAVRQRGGPVLRLISAPLLDYQNQPSPTVGGGAEPAPR